MPLADDPDAFEAAFRAAVAAVLPSATIERTARTVIAVKLRVALGEDHFIDVFFNSRNGRMDLALRPRTTWLASVVLPHWRGPSRAHTGLCARARSISATWRGRRIIPASLHFRSQGTEMQGSRQEPGRRDGYLILC
jgi:hypothetical protein